MENVANGFIDACRSEDGGLMGVTYGRHVGVKRVVLWMCFMIGMQE